MLPLRLLLLPRRLECWRRCGCLGRDLCVWNGQGSLCRFGLRSILLLAARSHFRFVGEGATRRCGTLDSGRWVSFYSLCLFWRDVVWPLQYALRNWYWWVISIRNFYLAFFVFIRVCGSQLLSRPCDRDFFQRHVG